MPSTSPGLKIASIRGVPVYIARTWLLIAVLVIATFGPQVHSSRPEWGLGAYALAAVFTLLLLISVLAHEVAHTLAALSRGYRVDRIVADLWGGHTSYDAHDATPGHLAFISAVGPLANFVLGGLGYVLLTTTDLPEAPYLLAWAFMWSNTFVAIFNSLPGLPLDGGFIVDALVWKLTGNRASGMRAAGWCGRIVAVLVIAWAAWPVINGHGSTFSLVWMVLIAMFLWRGASAAVAVGGNRQVLSSMSLAAVTRPAVVVSAETPISSAPESGATLVLVDASGTPVGTVPPGAHVQVPIEQRAVVPLSALALSLPAHAVVDVPDANADITAVLPPFAVAPPASLVVLTRVVGPGGAREVVGIVTYDDVERALQTQAHRLHSSP